MRQIIFNSSNVVNSEFKNTYEYVFPSPQKFEKGDAIAIAGATFYYSIYNISASIGNNTLQILWPQNNVVATYTTFNVTFPDGMYSINDINDYLQYFMIQNGMYLIDPNGDFVYYLEVVSNFNYYAFQFNFYPIPSALPAGYSQPGNFLNFNPSGFTPRININSGININLGFPTQPISFPPSGNNATFSQLSTITPQITSQNTFLVRCSLIQNRLASAPTDVIFAFSPNGEFGSLLSLDLDKYIFNSIQSGYYDRCRITLLDQNYQPLRLIDDNVLFSLVVWKKSEDGELQ